MKTHGCHIYFIEWWAIKLGKFMRNWQTTIILWCELWAARKFMWFVRTKLSYRFRFHCDIAWWITWVPGRLLPTRSIFIAMVFFSFSVQILWCKMYLYHVLSHMVWCATRSANINNIKMTRKNMTVKKWLGKRKKDKNKKSSQMWPFGQQNFFIRNFELIPNSRNFPMQTVLVEFNIEYSWRHH